MHHLHGIATKADLAEAGISEGQLARSPGYERVAAGHYALPGSRRDFWFNAALAQTVAGEDSRLTSHSALHLLGVLDQPGRVVQVVVPEGKGSRKRQTFNVRRAVNLPDVVTTRSGLRSVPVAYAICDYGRDASDGAVAFAISRALGLRLTTLVELAQVVAQRGKFPGSARLRRVLRDFDGVESHSKRERLLHRRLRRRGLTSVVAQRAVRDLDGRVVAKADLAVPEIKLIIEVDGPHHFSPAQQEADRQRDRRLRALGWTTIRITCYELDENPERVVAEILRLVAQLRADLAA
ncbi:DUF559 domain-containing protein [Euzebya tangerina]|uniref:DUF559 domain-containing protein n=1 Tax=Euzebya tangerina TaxID=591198 RepID=UPI000E31292A|nr:DUF559 domain-containing protein [Euzebya tangerina]